MIAGVAPFSLYLHIPYCDSKCPYCDFNSVAVKRWPERAYCDALIAELRAAAADPLWHGTLQTVFFGGGTPSLLAPASIARVCEAIAASWTFADRAIEVTLEANPGTVDRDKLRGFAAAGINRISFGVQSFHPVHLAQLGRIHGSAEARAAVPMAREAGIANVNVDLMFAIPGQTLAEWAADLATVVDLAPDHVSAYNLTYEDSTPFGARRRDGSIVAVPEEAEVAMFVRTAAVLSAHGYTQYEISNYARPGRACAHNLNYWRSGGYLGLGAGAHSFSPAAGGGRRWSNEKHAGRYMDRIAAAGEARVTDESLRPEQARGEFVFLGLRCRDGFAEREFQHRFGAPFLCAYPHAERFVRDGHLERVGERWQLTARGLVLADAIFATFL